MQPAFGGGALDGYAILLDVPDVETPSALPKSYPRMNVASRAVFKKTDSLAALADGKVFHFKPDFPRFVTADAEFRHAADSEIYFDPRLHAAPPGSQPATPKPFDPPKAPRWPSFLFGRSVSGEMKWVVHRDTPDLLVDGKTVGQLTGSATVTCAHWLQVTGDQSRRVLGELIQGKQPAEFPAVGFTLSDLGRMKVLPLEPQDGMAGKKVAPAKVAEGKGRLEVAGRVIDCNVKCLLNYQETMPDKGAPGMAIDAFFTVKGKDLGLSGLADLSGRSAPGPFDINANLVFYSSDPMHCFRANR
jgi:hypothetical protein